MELYNHGITVKEKSTTLTPPPVSTSGIQIVFGIAPVNLLSNPKSAVNKLFLCKTFDEAQSCLGYSSDIVYTLCQSMDCNFKKFNVAPVVFCNVLNPEVHKKTNQPTEYEIQFGKVTIPLKGILLGSIVVMKSGDNVLTSGTDYITSFDNEGNAVIAFLGSQTGKVIVSCDSIDPGAVTSSDIIGGVDSITHVETGLELIRQVYPTFGIVPNTIIAPGYSKDPNVAAAMDNKCQKINGCFTAECVVDLDTTTATDYTKCADVKKNAYLNGNHTIIVWPKIKVDDRIFYYSAVYAALMASTDYENGDVPNISPSNKAIAISGAVLEDGAEVVLDEPQANVLNGAGIVTIINQGGWRSWGNNMACYPGNKDPKDRWICCRRFFSWWGNSFILAYKEKVDSPANFRLIESIVDSENIRGNSYTAQDKCAGCKIVYNVDENPIENILDGGIKFHQYLAPYTPAEHIENMLEFDPAMLQAALSGGEE